MAILNKRISSATLPEVQKDARLGSIIRDVASAPPTQNEMYRTINPSASTNETPSPAYVSKLTSALREMQPQNYTSMVAPTRSNNVSLMSSQMPDMSGTPNISKGPVTSITQPGDTARQKIGSTTSTSGGVPSAVINALAGAVMGAGASKIFGSGTKPPTSNPSSGTQKPPVTSTVSTLPKWAQGNPTITDNKNGTYTQKTDDGSTLLLDKDGNIISTTDSNGDIVDKNGSTVHDNGNGTHTIIARDGTTTVVNDEGTVIVDPHKDDYTEYPVKGPVIEDPFPINDGSDYFPGNDSGEKKGGLIAMMKNGGVAHFSPGGAADTPPVDTPPFDPVQSILDLLKTSGGAAGAGGLLAALLSSTGGSQNTVNTGLDMSTYGLLNPRTTNFGMGPARYVPHSDYSQRGSYTPNAELLHNLNAPASNPVNEGDYKSPYITNRPGTTNNMTGSTDINALIAQIVKAFQNKQLLQNVNQASGTPTAGTPTAGTPKSIDPNHPWSTASSDPKIKSIQDELEQLSQTKGTPEQRQAVLQNFLKTTNYTPAQLAAASNGMWSVSDLTSQMAGNPVLKQSSNAPSTSNAASNNPSPTSNAAASTPSGGGFVTGGGNTGGEYGAFGSKAAYDKAVADETARRNAKQAELDKYHVSPDSPFYAAYMAATGQRKDDIKDQDKELRERIARRTAISQMGYGEGFISNGTLMGPNGPIYPNENEVGVTVTDANGRNRYQTKAEAAEIERKTQQYLMDHGNIIDPNKPFNVASTDAGTQSVQAALAKLSQTPGDDKTRQAALQNFLKTTTFTPEQLSAASNGQWAVSDLKAQMAGNPVLSQTDTNNVPTDLGVLADQMRQKQTVPSNTVDTGGGLADLTPTKNNFTPAAPTAGGLNALAGQISAPMTGVIDGGITKTGPQELDPNSIYQNPGSRALTQEDIDQMKIFDDMRNGKSPTLDPKDLYQNPGDPGQQPEFNGGYPVQNQSAQVSSGPTPEEIQAMIDAQNAYSSPGGAKRGGAIHKATGGLTHYTYGKPADVMENLGLRGQQMAQGGLPHMSNVPLVQGRMDFRQGSAVHGEGDGQSDDIPAMLADGEYVIDAETVAQIGNGSTKAGAQALDKFREGIRAHKRSAPINKIPPKTKALTSYLKVK